MKALKNATVMIMRPQESFLEWMIQLDPSARVESHSNVLDMTAVLMCDMSYGQQLSEFLMANSEALLVHEYSRWSKDEDTWPLRCDLEMLMTYFRLEFHEDILQFEDAINNAKYLTLLKPTVKLQQWLKNTFIAAGENPQELEQVRLDKYQEQAVAYLLPSSIQSRAAIINFFEENYASIFEYELSRFVTDKKFWPDNRDFLLFTEWFLTDSYSILRLFT